MNADERADERHRRVMVENFLVILNEKYVWTGGYEFIWTGGYEFIGTNDYGDLYCIDCMEAYRNGMIKNILKSTDFAITGFTTEVEIENAYCSICGKPLGYHKDTLDKLDTIDENHEVEEEQYYEEQNEYCEDQDDRINGLEKDLDTLDDRLIALENGEKDTLDKLDTITDLLTNLNERVERLEKYYWLNTNMRRRNW
jgi:hypothetical protein